MAAASSGKQHDTSSLRSAAQALAEEERALHIAKQYMEWSSSHELDKVFTLFTNDACYTSEALRGTWIGLTDIQNMMRPFFTRFPDVTWEVTRMFVTDRIASKPCPQQQDGEDKDQDQDGADDDNDDKQRVSPMALPEAKDGILHVEVHFIRRWTEGTSQEARGREWISVDVVRNRIVYVHVAKLGTFWDFW